MIDRDRLAALYAAEQRRFTESHPKSRALYERAQGSLLDGVPMHWMAKWAGGFPLFVAEGQGAHFTDVDGHRYLDLCLGDTGAMTGHAPDGTVEAVKRQAERGFTFMLPTEDHVWVAEELARRFGLPCWQFALTATDANRFAIRLARMLTGRPKILVSTGATTARWTRPSPPCSDGAVTPAARQHRPPGGSALRPREWWSSTTSRRWKPRSPTATSPACWPSRR